MTQDNPYKISDPVTDLAQGRPMVVLEAPDTTVAEWSEANGYELSENYANGKLGADPDEPVVRCVYVSDIRSDPSKDYTFPVSRVALIDAHHADDGRRLYDRVARDVLEQLFLGASDIGVDAVAANTTEEALTGIVAAAGFDDDLIGEARELADVERTIGGDDATDPSSGGGFEA